jgi:hypothetical protein
VGDLVKKKPTGQCNLVPELTVSFFLENRGLTLMVRQALWYGKPYGTVSLMGRRHYFCYCRKSWKITDEASLGHHNRLKRIKWERLVLTGSAHATVFTIPIQKSINDTEVLYIMRRRYGLFGAGGGGYCGNCPVFEPS